MNNWLSMLKIDPLKKLLASGDDMLTYLVRRDILEESSRRDYNSRELENIIKKQQSNGSWKFNSSSRVNYPSINHDLIETFKSFGILTGKYELDREHEAISKCAGYIFSCQTDSGDIRGILGNQYMPYYCGLLLEYLIKAGYGNDFRVTKAFEWLINTRQNDGGWVIPLQTIKVNKTSDFIYASEPISADCTLPSSHLATGMVLRAFAVHPDYKRTNYAVKAGELLKSRFFKPDRYNDRKARDYWLKFQFPFWWTTLLSALDSLYYIGFTIEIREIENAIEWFLVNQDEDGLWKTNYDKGDKQKVESKRLWVAYSICRILKIYLD